MKGYGLVQTATQNFSNNADSVIKGTKLHNEEEVSWLANFSKANSGETFGGRLNHDSKYYLKLDNGTGSDANGYNAKGSNRANFDVFSGSSSNTKVQLQVAFTISADTEGNIVLKQKVLQNNTERSVSDKQWTINQKQTAKDLINQDGNLKILDDNTKLITNFCGTTNTTESGTSDGFLDRNQGGSYYSRRANGADDKYNEAYDGLGIIYTFTTADIGFGGAGFSDRRTNILDPLLSAKADSKSDLYNFKSKPVRTSIFRTEEIPNSPAKESTAGYLATVPNLSTIKGFKLKFKNPSKLAYSKLFYIPNATVSDLS